jgi:hypothetical protein
VGVGASFALPDSILLVPRAPGAIFMFFAPILIFGGIEGIGTSVYGPIFCGIEGAGSSVHVLCSRTRF